MKTTLTTVCALCLCVSALAWRTNAHNATQAPDQGGNDELAKKGKARLEAAEKAYKGWYRVEELQVAKFSGLLYQVSIQWLSAESDLATKREERVGAYKAHLNRMNEWAKLYKLFEGADSRAVLVINSFQREAEYWLAKETSKK